MTSEKMQNMVRDYKPEESASGSTVVVARQPIFDLTGNIAAYELLFRDPSMRPGLGNKNSHAATSTVMVDGFEVMRPSLRPGQRFFINFTEELLEAELVSFLPPQLCVVEILETVNPTDAVIKSLQHLKQKGYTLALDDFVGQKELVPFIPMVDILKVEVLGRTPAQLQSLVNALGFFKGRLLAEKVEDYVTARLCKDLNFSLFQGWFFSKAELVQGKKLTPSQMTKNRLLRYASSDIDDFTEIREAIAADVYLSYKLLRYVNSVHFGLPVPVRTVDRAITMLGKMKLRQWLCVTALADLDSTPMAKELVVLSAQRAKFLELLAEAHLKKSGGDAELPHLLFLIGLFSLLESMLHMPMSDILASLPLTPEQMDVLSYRKGPYAPWLDLMEEYEKGQWEDAHLVAQRLSLSYADLSKAYAEASTWSQFIYDEAAP